MTTTRSGRAPGGESTALLLSPWETAPHPYRQLVIPATKPYPVSPDVLQHMKQKPLVIVHNVAAHEETDQDKENEVVEALPVFAPPKTYRSWGDYVRTHRDNKRYKTRFCVSVMHGIPCPHKVCWFAHSWKELQAHKYK